MPNDCYLRHVVSVVLLLITSVSISGRSVCHAEDLHKLEIRSRKTLRTLEDKKVTLKKKALLTLTDDKEPILNSEIHFASPDAWIHFRNVKPSDVNERFLSNLYVNGRPAELDRNIRLTPVVQGTMAIPHGPKYQALKAYKESGYKGASQGFIPHKYYRSEELSEWEDQITSFVLKHGYMATLAENNDGTGASKVFIADEEDVRIARLPKNLAGKVSFVRVFPWRWTGKKGFGGKAASAQMLGSNWRYGWDAGGESTLDMEYVPMRHNASWDSFTKINSKLNVTHLLGFNEPMQKDQANMSMDKVLKMWPKLQASGLRLGSPCPTDAKLNWLYEFIDKADERGLRVDFVAVHYYKGNWPQEKLINWLRNIHERTGRPVWLTEFNNGAPWVKNHNPTKQEQAKKIQEYCQAMDRASFVERYAIFNLGHKNYNRQVIIDGKLTPAGRLYSQNPSKKAYSEQR